MMGMRSDDRRAHRRLTFDNRSYIRKGKEFYRHAHFLIRHGESITNTGENYVNRIPDHLVSLTERGIAQARENGAWLADISTKIDGNRFWGSP
jgi:hypothetical protein